MGDFSLEYPMSSEQEAFRVTASKANALLKSADTSDPRIIIRDLLKTGTALLQLSEAQQTHIDLITKRLEDCERHAAKEPR
jgi:hypothetical protein